MPSKPMPSQASKTVTIYKCGTCGVQRVDRDEFEVLQETKARVTGYLTVIQECKGCKYKRASNHAD